MEHHNIMWSDDEIKAIWTFGHLKLRKTEKVLAVGPKW